MEDVRPDLVRGEGEDTGRLFLIEYGEPFIRYIEMIPEHVNLSFTEIYFRCRLSGK